MSDIYTNSKHPKTLYLLFFTEMWERFSFYGLQALLMIYMITEVHAGGLGYNIKLAGNVYGLYAGLVFFLPLFGGIIADKFLGNQICIIFGGILIALGHVSLALSFEWSFFAGLILLVLGVGLFKPNISSMVGQLYPEGSPLKDSAYTIFYMGINIGSIGGTLICSYLGERVGWHLGFGAAAIGMVLGLIIFIIGKSKLGKIGTKPEKQLIGVISKEQSLTKVQKDHLMVIYILSFFAIIYFVAWEQMASSVSLFCLKYTDRYLPYFDFIVPAGWYQSLNPILIVIFVPFLSRLWVKLAEKNKDLSIPVKFAGGFFILGLAFLILAFGSMGIQGGQNTASVSMWYVITFYVFQVLSEISFYPIGLSTINKLAPPRLYSFMFGVWLAANGIGNYLSGALTGFIEEISLSSFFMISVVIMVLAGIWLLLISKKLNFLIRRT